MVRLMKDLLAESARETFVGRSEELEVLAQLFSDGPRVIFVHGIAGVGKTSLLNVLAESLREKNVAVFNLDCRSIEPTERGFLHALSSSIGGSVNESSEASAHLQLLGRDVLLSLDNYESFRLLDTWLRQVFIPHMPDNVRFIISGRDAPLHSWFTTQGWHGVVRNIPLGPLNDAESVTLLVDQGATEHDARSINRFALGHPLALKLAAIVSMETGVDNNLSALGFQRVFEQLMKLYLADVHDPATRRALDAASVVRRITVSLLEAMLPDLPAQDLFVQLRSLPFVENDHDGLRLHDLVQQSISATLQATDPNRYQQYRRAAWQQLSSEARRTGAAGLWRYTADLLYMIANPVVREAFFPTSDQRLVVEPAEPADGPAILELSQFHESTQGTELLQMWWKHLPGGFQIVRDIGGRVVGFYFMFDPANVRQDVIAKDPIVEKWSKHLQEEPLPDHQRALFLRRWLSKDDGEKPGPVQAACWLDIKRTYMGMRPQLRRVYLALSDFTPYLAVASRLCFQPLKVPIEVEGILFSSAVLDFGPGSVDGWLARLGTVELGIEEKLLDPEAHEIVIDGERVKLTKLEFEVLQYLHQHEGKAVTRASLVENVWGWKHTGSNVVEAVMRTLRKKLGTRSSSIETIRGLGYRFRSL